MITCVSFKSSSTLLRSNTKGSVLPVRDCACAINPYQIRIGQQLNDLFSSLDRHILIGTLIEHQG